MNSDGPLATIDLTVGIPTMNNEGTIRGTLESLLEQSRPPDRIIVVDASDDRTPDIVKNIASKSDVRIDYYRQSDRGGRGVGRARQDIYEYFDEDVLACLDTNLKVSNDWVEQRVQFHKENPEFGILSGTNQGGLDEEVTDHKSPHYFRQANCSLTAGALNAVDGWDPWMPRGEDWDIHIRLARAGARSYVKSSLPVEQINQESGLSVVRKNLRRPSAVQFLRKYGIWYAQFHPLHPLGEIASFLSAACIVASVILAVTANPLSLVALSISAASTFIYLHHRILRHRDGIYFQRDDLVWVTTFLLMWVSTARELRRRSGVEWNYGGV